VDHDDGPGARAADGDGHDPDVFQDTVASLAARPEPPPLAEPAPSRRGRLRGRAKGQAVPPPRQRNLRGRAGVAGAPPNEPPAGRTKSAGDEGPRSRGRTAIVRLAALAALLLTAFAIWFIISLFQPFKGSDGFGTVRVDIPRGADGGRIGDILEARDVVPSAFFFSLRARLDGQDLKGGSYVLKRDMSYEAALNDLAKGPPPVRTTAITIPEGRSRREEAARIRTTSLSGSYLAATKRSSVLDPRDYGARGAAAQTLEGFLYPDTYEVRPSGSVRSLVTKQLREFKRRFRTVDLGRARRASLTPYEVLIIASMIERETSVRRERPLIASVVYNRLRDGIPLGIDATTRFATNNWTRPLRQSDLRSNSPYNTRTRQGLPPTPIGSPGIGSIRAAANPRRTDYLFFVVRPGGCHAFSETDAEFQRDVARYQSARAARGGRSPGKCA